jgi:hypothetical protein
VTGGWKAGMAVGPLPASAVSVACLSFHDEMLPRKQAFEILNFEKFQKF